MAGMDRLHGIGGAANGVLGQIGGMGIAPGLVGDSA